MISMHGVLRHKWLLIQSLFFLVLSLSFIVPNGDFHCLQDVCTLSIGQWQMHDALWHISLAKLGFVSWPLANPFIAGQKLGGYNFLLDAILFTLMKLGLSPFFAFFKLIPTVAALLYVFSVMTFVKLETTKELKRNLLTFFLFFGNSMSYLATLYQSHNFYYASLRGFPVVSAIEPSTMFQNLQYSFSLSLLLWIIIISKRAPQKWDKVKYACLFFLLFGFKFYAGVVAVLLSVALLALQKGQHHRRSLVATSLTIGVSSLLGLYVFYGISGHTPIPFSWAPFALTHLMIDDSLLFYNHGLTLARYYLYASSHGFSPRLLLIEGWSIFLFLLMNFGIRLLGVGYLIWLACWRRASRYHLVLLLIVLLTTLAPILFVQDGGWYNTMQFLYYGVWLAGIFTAEYVYALVCSRRWYGLLLAIIVIGLTIPNDLEQLRFLTAPQNVVSSTELEALSILKAAPEGIVHVNDPIRKNGLIPALAEKYPYYLDTDQLMVTHANYQERLAYLTKYSGGSIANVPADYFYIYKQEVASPDAYKALSDTTNFTKLYDSDTIAVFKRIKR